VKPRIKVIGADATAKKLIERANMSDEFDEATENSMKRVQLGAFHKAPELTGFLKSNLVADENRKRTEGVPKGSWDLVDGTDYTLIQEFEHRNKAAFIRRSVWDEEPKFRKDVENLAKKGKKKSWL